MTHIVVNCEEYILFDMVDDAILLTKVIDAYIRQPASARLIES